MSKFIQGQGYCQVILNPAESLVVQKNQQRFEFVLNESNIWSVPINEVSLIQVLSHEELSYKPSQHQDYLAALFADLGIQQGVCVDIGAYDGLNYSHTLGLFKQGWSGLAIECQPDRFARLAEAYRHMPWVSLSRHKVCPASIVPLLSSQGISESFDFLSLDIDSYDYHILEALLKSFHPSVICAEINEVIPPPIRFSLNYDPEFELDLSTRLYGQSLAMLADLAARHGYSLLKMHYMDVFLIDSKLVSGEPLSLAEIYRQGLLEQPLPAYYAHYPFDVQALWQSSPQAALELIQAGWPEHQKYQISLEPIQAET